MINIKKINYINGKHRNVSAYGIYDIIKFLELDNYNVLTIKHVNDTHFNHLHNISYSSFDNFKKIISDKSNLFRINLILLSLINMDMTEMGKYVTEISDLNISCIIYCDKYLYKSSDDVNDYTITRDEETRRYIQKYYLTDNINNWCSSFDDLKKSYIRDKKINNILGKTE
jgi:hypothetical protein